MPYIPFRYDNDMMAVLLILWAIGGTVAVVLGRQRALPKQSLGRRAIAAAVGAIVSIFAYSLYVLQRQAVEAHNSVVVRQFLRHEVQ